jgi:hypothetical protein
MKRFTTNEGIVRNIAFIRDYRLPLAQVLTRPLRAVTIGLDGIDRPLVVRLHHHGSSEAIQIQSQMFDVAPRKEVGALRFSRGTIDTEKTLAITVPQDAAEIIRVEKLVIEENAVKVESGVVLTNSAAEQFVVVAGAQPYGLYGSKYHLSGS